MVNIDSFKSWTEYIANKVQIGNSLTIPQFNQLCYQAVLQVQERDYQTLLATEEVSTFLKTYFKSTILNVPLTGEVNYPSDYQHLASLRKYYVQPNGKSKMIDIEEIKNEAWGLTQISSLKEPMLRFPKYNQFSNVIRFLPRNIGIVEIDYFKTPVQPIWGYTIASGRPVYSPSTSVNFDFNQFAMNEVSAVFLSFRGVNLKDNELQAFVQMYKQETDSVL